MDYRIVTNTDVDLIVSRIANELIRAAVAAKDPLSFMAVSVIGGDRHLCCDEAVVAFDGSVPVGMATIAPKGESGAGMPEIVGVFVLAKYRRRGVGRELFIRAISRCRERRLVPLRATILSKGMGALVKNLPPDILTDVQISDQSHLSPF